MSFQRNLSESGFVVIENLLSQKSLTAAALCAEQAYLKEHHLAIKSNLLPLYFSEDNPFPCLSPLLKNDILNFMRERPALAPTLFGSVSVNTRLSECFTDLLRKVEIINVLSDLLDSKNVFLHLSPAVRVIHPNLTCAHVPPHNDLSYNPHFRYQEGCTESLEKLFLTVWIPLRSIWGVDGGLSIFPNQRSQEICNPSETFWIPDMSNGMSKAIFPQYSVGDLIIFQPDLIHGSAEVSGDASAFRISMDCRVFGSNTSTSKHYMNLSTGERFDPGEGPCAHAQS